MKLLRYSGDRRTVLLLGSALFLTLLPYILAGHAVRGPLYYLIFFLVQTYISYMCGAINHNHTHHSTFHGRVPNLLMNQFLSFSMGRSTSYLVIPHNFNHHGNFGKESDWSDPRKIGHFRGVLGVVVYSVRIFCLMTRYQGKEATLRTRPRLMRRIFTEQVFLVAFFAALIWWNWTIFILSSFPGFVAAIFGLLAINLFQHGLCDLESDHDHSRNFVSPVYNWIFVNNGYHTYHHDYPKAHWTELPALHLKWVDPHINPRFNERSFLRFVFLEFLWVGPKTPIVKGAPTY